VLVHALLESLAPLINLFSQVSNPRLLHR
jgi:hypothetical protein